jgi:Uma2 family endonuclease
MSTRHKTSITPQEYLALEREAETKSEFYAGEVFALAGASPRHNLIAGNVLAAIHTQLKNRDCKVFPSDLRVKVPGIPYYTYPDVTVVCGELKLEDEHQDNLVNPVAIFEVLSTSTERRDRGSKFESYRRIESLREYILIAQDTHRVEQYSKQPDETWVFSETTDADGTLKLASIGCELGLNDIYAQVDF